MKTFILVIIATVFFACTLKKEAAVEESTKNSDSVVAKAVSIKYLFKSDTVIAVVRSHHEKISGIKGDLASFKKYIANLDKAQLTTIALSLDYIKSCIPVTSPDNDSICYIFNSFLSEVSNSAGSTIDQDLTQWHDQLLAGSTPATLSGFQKNLEVCGLGIYTTEGTLYLDILSNYLSDNFKDRVSDGTRQYLALRKDELKQGFSEDAGMLISFDELYSRIKNWELFITKYPDNVYSSSADGLFQTYLETLLTGMDNSRIFNIDNNTLTPEIKALYEKVISNNDNLRSTKIISDYYNFLKARGFKGDSIEVFLKSKEMSTMLAVQPHTR